MKLFPRFIGGINEHVISVAEVGGYGYGVEGEGSF